MKFSNLAKYLDKLEKTASRNEITEILADLFKNSSSKEIDKIVYLLLGSLAPSYENIVFNIAERMMLSVIADVYKKDIKEVSTLYKKKGDLGIVAQEISKETKSAFTVVQVYDELKKIALDEGKGSQERKIKNTAKLLGNLDSLSARFVTRIPIGKLRLGFSDKTIIDALSWMKMGDKSAKSELEKAYFVLPDVGLLAKKVKETGIKRATKNVKPKVGVPVLPMLAQRLKSPTEMIKKMKEVAVEPKLDGLRISIHYKAGKNGFTKAFTRNMNETSWMFPELKNIAKSVRAREIILDSEAIGVDKKTKILANFQQTMNRRRKHDIEKISSKLGIKFYIFDLLYKDGKSLLDKQYIQRRKVLEKTIEKSSLFQVVDYVITKDPKVIEKEMTRELSDGMEGIIVKRANSRYIAGRTGWRWVKMKETEKALAKLADTVDCLVLGYTQGKGKRAVFGVGQFLVGVRDDEKFKTITKVGTGLTDDQFRELKKRLGKLEVNKKPKEYVVDKDLEPDFWVEPSLIVEIAADEITKSPKHTSGYALRFPRLIKFRDDKGAKQATTIKEIKKLFKLQ